MDELSLEEKKIGLKVVDKGGCSGKRANPKSYNLLELLSNVHVESDLPQNRTTHQQIRVAKSNLLRLS